MLLHRCESFGFKGTVRGPGMVDFATRALETGLGRLEEEFIHDAAGHDNACLYAAMQYLHRIEEAHGTHHDLQPTCNGPHSVRES